MYFRENAYHAEEKKEARLRRRIKKTRSKNGERRFHHGVDGSREYAGRRHTEDKEEKRVDL